MLDVSAQELVLRERPLERPRHCLNGVGDVIVSVTERLLGPLSSQAQQHEPLMVARIVFEQ